MRSNRALSEGGFTLIELMIAMAISLVIMGSIFFSFKSQQTSYVTQDRVAKMHQNLRAAMHMITRDIQMGGFLTSVARNSYSMNWDPTTAANENILPTIWGRDNDATAGNDVQDGTDLIVIVMASGERRSLVAGESVAGGSNLITGSALDLNGGGADFDITDRRCGVLVQGNLGQAEFFEVASVGAGARAINNFSQSYSEGDTIARADVIIYRINDNNTTFNSTVLERRNLGNDNGFQVVAEDITDMQFSYHLSNNTWGDAGAAGWNQASIREVRVTLTSAPNGVTRTRSLTTTVKVRNLGL